MHLTGAQALLLLAIVCGYAAGAIATVVNCVLILMRILTKAVLNIPGNLAWWAYYALPWLIYWSGSYRLVDGLLPPLFTPTPNLATMYLYTIPFAAIGHFIYLVRMGPVHSLKM